MDMQEICKEYQWSDLIVPGTSWDILGPQTYKERRFHPGTWSISPSSWEPHNATRQFPHCLFLACFLGIKLPSAMFRSMTWLTSWSVVFTLDIISIIKLTRLGANHKFMNYIDYSCIMLHLLSGHLISHLPRWLSHWASKHWSFPLVDRSWPESRKVRIQHDTWNQEFSTKFYGTRPSVEMVKMSTSYMFIYINLAYVGIFWQFLILYIYNYYIFQILILFMIYI